MRFKTLDIQPSDRIHMTNDAKLTFKDIDIEENTLSGVMKPAGLWYAMGRSWMEWIESEKMNWWKKHLYKIEINPDKILFLDTPDKVNKFTEEYQRPGYMSTNIYWAKVAKEYSGVEFNPYFDNLRFKLGLTWYYTVDVPSGCIWNKSGIKNIVRL